MKIHIIIPFISVLAVGGLFAQETTVVPVPPTAVERAIATTSSADLARQTEAEVLTSSTPAPSVQSTAVTRPEPRFAQPAAEVTLDLPGSVGPAVTLAGDQETISVDFPAEDVRDIIRSVADLYELNVVIPDTLTGSVSIKLRNVTWQQVFNVVLEPLKFTYIIEGNIIKIKSREELALEPVETRVFIVDFAKAGEIRGSIEPMVDPSKGGKLQVDVRSNALVITERPSRMNAIQEIIQTLDRPTEQVMIESKFVEISARNSSNMGIDWQSLAGFSVQAGPFQRDFSRKAGDLIDDPSGFNNQFPGTARFDTAVFSADTFSVVLSALKGMGGIELVSNPTVVTMNNTPAQINIGEEFPIPSYTYNQERGVFEISNFEYKNIGINLKVTPQINSAGFINLNIQPELSSRSGVVEFGGASGASIPIIATRKTNSTVIIKSGYTLAIGGLIENKEEERNSKVPVLGSIPGLGRLFSSSGTQMEQRNLIIFITAKILSASGATYEDVFPQKTLLDLGIRPRDLPGFQPPAEEQQLLGSIQQSQEDLDRIQEEIRLRQQLRQLEDQRAAKLEQSAQAEEETREIRRRYK